MKVLITGGSRGIGRACVELFAKEGHDVLFLYRSSDADALALCEKTGAKAIKCDISMPYAATNAAKEAICELGGIDVLINNAGISQNAFFDSITDAQWESMLGTNLSGAFYVTREVTKEMIRSKSGRVINIGSMWGKVGASCEVHYSAAKAGMRGMTMALAKELGPSGITVNCIEPGVIRTDMNSHLTEEDIAALCEETPLGRTGTPEEVAHLAYFLSSEKAGFITGQCICIDGGFAI